MITQEELAMVALPSMNNTHLEDIIIVNKLRQAAQDKDFELSKSSFVELIEHSMVHFSSEEEMMIEKNFPLYSAHKIEHDRVIEELNSVSGRFSEGEGDFELVKAYIDGALAPWLVDHVKTLDTAAALFFKNSN